MEKNYISKEDADIYKKMVEMRNILAHEYLDINKRVIYDSITNNIEDLKKFIIFVSKSFI